MERFRGLYMGAERPSPGVNFPARIDREVQINRFAQAAFFDNTDEDGNSVSYKVTVPTSTCTSCQGFVSLAPEYNVNERCDDCTFMNIIASLLECGAPPSASSTAL